MQFLYKGAGVQLKTSDGRSALHVAASSGHFESAELLLRHGAQMNVKDQLGDTPLHKAAKGEILNFFENLNDNF